jgi:hypothetical protein
MHLPRWLLVSLIAVSGVALVAVPAWLWVEMPRRTAERFVAAAKTRDTDTLTELLGACECDGSGRLRIKLNNGETIEFGETGYYVVPRSLAEMLLGRQSILEKINDGKGRVVITASYRRVTARMTWYGL